MTKRFRTGTIRRVISNKNINNNINLSIQKMRPQPITTSHKNPVNQQN